MKSLRILLCGLVVACCSSSLAQIVPTNPPTGRYTVKVYHVNSFSTSGDFDNPLPGPTYGGDPPEWDVPDRRIVFSLDLTGQTLAAGEILLAFADMQVHQEDQCDDHDSGHPHAGVFSGIYLGTGNSYDPDDELGSANAGFRMSEHGGEDLAFDFGLPKYTYVKIGTYAVPGGLPSDRKYVNLHAFIRHDCNERVFVDGDDSETDNSQLTVVRFTPTATEHPWAHGVELALAPSTSTEVTGSITATSPDEPDIVYQINLNPDGTQGNSDDFTVVANDVIIAVGECQANYDAGTVISFGTQLRLVNSDESVEVAITKPNEFSMKGGSNDIRTKSTAVKAGALTITAPPSGTYWRYVRLVAWAPNRQANDEVLVTDPNALLGKLSLARFRKAQQGSKPVAVQRYDKYEYNHYGPGDPNNDYGIMERQCTLTSSTHIAEFTQELVSLSSNEILLAASELELTNQDDGTPLKNVYSRLVIRASSSSTDGDTNYGNITTPNQFQVHRDATHHGLSMKVGIEKVSSAVTSPGTYYVNRAIWSDNAYNGVPCDFTGEMCVCDDAPTTCTPIDCACQSSICDVINQGQGRLAVLRFNPDPVLCSADCAPPGGNCVVNTADLLALIFNWGSTTATWEDVNEDGIVGVSDLLAVINAWGNCPACGGGIAGGPPQTVSDCFNIFCAGLQGEDWENCLSKCLNAVCANDPSQCD